MYIKVDEQKKVESVKEFYENQEEKAKQNYERTSQNFVTVRKLQLLSEWISLSYWGGNSALRLVVSIVIFAAQFCLQKNRYDAMCNVWPLSLSEYSNISKMNFQAELEFPSLYLASPLFTGVTATSCTRARTRLDWFELLRQKGFFQHHHN